MACDLPSIFHTLYATRYFGTSLFSRVGLRMGRRALDLRTAPSLYPAGTLPPQTMAPARLRCTRLAVLAGCSHQSWWHLTVRHLCVRCAMVSECDVCVCMRWCQSTGRFSNPYTYARYCSTGLIVIGTATSPPPAPSPLFIFPLSVVRTFDTHVHTSNCWQLFCTSFATTKRQPIQVPLCRI